LPIEPLLILELAALGCATGFLAGLLGIGGGMLMVPFITLAMDHRGIAADVAVKVAIATSMATIILTSISSVRAHHQHGAVRWDLVRRLAPGIVAGALFGSLAVFSLLKGTVLAVVFALFTWTSAAQMFFGRKPSPTRQLPGAAGQFGFGALIGFASGLLGAGGAFISVPFMTRGNVPIHHAVATSAALGFPIAVANVAGYIVSGQSASGLPPASFGYIWLPALVTIAAASVLTAPLGARATHRLPVGRLRQGFAVLLCVLGTYMLWKGLSPR